MRIFVFFVFITPSNVQFYWGDAPAYVSLAENIASGKGFLNANGRVDTLWFPAYPYFLAFLLIISGGNCLIAAIFQIILSCFIPLLIYFIGNKLFNAEVSFIASAIAIFYPLLVFFSGIFSWAAFIALSLLLLVFISIDIARRLYLRTVLLAVLSSIIFLAHSEFLFLAPLILIWFAMNLRKQPRRLAAAAAVYLISWTLISSPWYIRNYNVYGRFILEPSLHGGSALYQGNNEFSDGTVPNQKAYGHIREIDKKIRYMSDIEKNRHYYKLSLNFISKYPRTFFILCIKRFFAFWAIFPRHESLFKNTFVRIINLCTYGTLIPFIIIGFISGLKEWKRLFLLYSIVILKVGVHVIVASGMGYRAVIDPFVIIFGALGIQQLSGKLKTKKNICC